MEFDEATAMHIIAKHNLSPNTYKTWQHRQSIPDKYASPSFEVRKKITQEHDKQQQANVLRALQTDKFNLGSLARLAALKEFIIADFKQQKTRLSQQELIAIKKAINTLRNEAKAILPDLDKALVPEANKKKLAQFIRRQELQFWVIMQRNKVPYDAWHAWANNRSSSLPGREHIAILKAALLVFITETTI